MAKVAIDPIVRKVFIFDEVYTFRAAEEQAEKNKMDAFGMLAKLNPFNRPKPETVLLVKKTQRYEPFWQVACQRSVDYHCDVTYPVPVHNPHAQTIICGSQSYDVARNGGKGKIDVAVREKCFRKIDYAGFIDGLNRETREIKPSTFESYVSKYKAQDVEDLHNPDAIPPQLAMASVVQIASSKLNSEAINAHDIVTDLLTFEKLFLYFRPVFAFEYTWSTTGKAGVIEVDGLTGEVIENGQWFKDKAAQVLTREMLFMASAEVAGHIVPGGGLMVKVIDRMTQPVKTVR